MALGKRIEEELSRQGWKQSDLAARVPGLSQQAISNLITRDSATSEFAIRIADAFGVSVRWLLDGQGRREDSDWPFPRVARHRWDACDSSERGYVEAAMNAALKECEAARPAEHGKPPAAAA
jgi:transcriptional regulator with XRE-family HTH domain